MTIEKLAEKSYSYVLADAERFPPEEGGTEWIYSPVSDAVDEETRGPAFFDYLPFLDIEEVEEKGLERPSHAGGRWRFSLRKGVREALYILVALEVIRRFGDDFEKRTGAELYL